VIIKLDYQYIYNRSTLIFFLKYLDQEVLGDIWIGWVSKIVIDGSLTAMANAEESNTFKTHKGLGQGDPLSPIMFNLHYRLVFFYTGKRFLSVRSSSDVVL
jgi:hypothetical protein